MRYIFLFIFLCLIQGLSAQNEDIIPERDKTFINVRDLADAGRNAEAIDIATIHLERDPEFYDLAVYTAALYGRTGEIEKGIKLLQPVFANNKSRIDAHQVRCNIYFWNEDWDALANASAEALAAHPGDADFLELQMIAASMLGDDKQALAIADQILDTDPDHIRAGSIKYELITSSASPELCLQYHYDHFTEPYLRRWHMITAGARLPVSSGTIIPYINAGHFIDPATGFIESSALQVNLDAYLNITDQNYLLAGYGFGTGTYLPVHRAALQLWQVLPRGWAVSAGGRYFYFDQHYIFYALGVEKYAGNYWFNLNNYIFNKDYGWTLATYFTIRRYLADKFNYMELTAGYGTSPDEPVTAMVDLQGLKALSVRFGLQKQVSARVGLGVSAGYYFEEYMDMNYRNRWKFQFSACYKL